MAEFYRLMLPGSIEARAAEGEREVFRAVITAEGVDRYGDVVIAKGLDVSAYRRNPVVLFGHRGDQPIGRATKVWRDGAQWLAEFTLATTERAQEVAALIREKVLGAVSIGFRPTEAPKVRKGDDGEWLGYVFPATELMEFSVVSVPAQRDALIQRAIAGDPSAPPGLPPPPLGRPRNPKGTPQMGPLASDIARFRKARQDALDQAETLYRLSQEEGREFSDEEQKQYDELLAEAQRQGRDAERAEKLERAQLETAAPVVPGVRSAPSILRPAGLGHNGGPPMKVEKGVAFARMAMAVAHAKGNLMHAAELAKQWRTSTPDVEAILRAAVAAGTTTDSTWAGPLLPQAQTLGGEMIELLLPEAILGRLNLRRVPFRVRVPRVTGGASAKWVGQGAGKPVSKAAFDTVSLDFNKLAVISVLTEELVRFSNPSAETTVRDLLVEAIRSQMDATLISNAAAVAGVSPAGLVNGVTPVASTGMTIAAITADVQRVLGNFLAAGIPLTGIAAVMNPFLRLILSGMRTLNDGYAFPEMQQGLFFGTRIVDSTAVPLSTVPVTTPIIFISEQNILLAQDPAMRVDVSREAAVEMSDDPDTDSGSLVSLWQNNLIGLLVEQFVTWTKARPAAVQVLTGLEAGPQA